MKGVVLAAGYGTRLKPITDRIPKPLVPFFGESLLNLTITKLEQQQINKIAINAHYLAAEIERFCLQRSSKADIFLSIEESILGTGGVYKNLKLWRENSAILVHNSDVVSDIKLDVLIKQHQKKKAIATMVLLPEQREGTTPIFFCPDSGEIISIGAEPDNKQKKNVRLEKGTFAGIQILSDQFLTEFMLEENKFELTDMYRQALQKNKRVQAVVFSGFWSDVGRAEDYFFAHKKLLSECLRRKKKDIFSLIGVEAKDDKNRGNYRLILEKTVESGISFVPPVFLKIGCQIEKDSIIGPNVIVQGSNISFKGKNIVQDCIFFDNVEIEVNRELKGKIIGEGFFVDI